MTRALPLALLFLCSCAAAFGQSDSRENRRPQVELESTQIDLLSIKNQVENLQQDLLEITRESRDLAAALSAQSDTFDALQQTVQQLDSQVADLTSTAGNDRQSRLAAHTLTADRFTSLEASVQSLASTLQTLTDQLSSYRQLLQDTQGELTDQLQAVGQDVRNQQAAQDELADQIQAVDQDVRNEVGRVDGELDRAMTTRWILVSGLIAGALGGAYGFRIFHRRIGDHSVEVAGQLDQAQKATRDEGVQLDSKLVEVLQQQLQLLKKEESEDHALALRITDELVRMDKNFSRMSEDTRGLKQLKASATRLKDTLEAKGYELVELLGQRYDAGMKVLVTFREDDTRPEGEEVITRIIKPQVNYKGQLIQAAQVEVSQGTKGHA